MALEIERRFLIDPLKLPQLPTKRFYEMVQGYLAKGVRVRRVVTIQHRPSLENPILEGPINGFITIKRTISHGTNKEFEYYIPTGDANELLELCEFRIIKTRYHYPVGSHIFEIDLFKDDLLGLVIGEVELSSIDEAVDIPGWFGPEITGFAAFSNGSLASTLNKREIIDYANTIIMEHAND